jgi:formylglycine-generating enzyme required for sulfatase activity
MIPLLGLTVLLLSCNNPFINNILDRNNRGNSEIHYSVTIDPSFSAGGTIIAKPESAPAGTNIILQVSPEKGNKLKGGSLKYRGEMTGEQVIDEDIRMFKLPAENVTVTAEFETLLSGEFSVSVLIEATDHGIIIAHPAFGIKGETINFTVIPDPGYRYRPGTLTSDGMPVDEISRSIVLSNADVTVKAEFEKVPAGNYSIRTESLFHGRIFPHPEYATAGSEVYLHVIPDLGYRLSPKSLKLKYQSGEPSVNENSGTFIMPPFDVTVTAEFEPILAPAHTVRVENMDHGYILARPAFGGKGEKISLIIVPDSGYKLEEKSLKYTSGAREEDIDDKFPVFDMPDEHVTISAKFKQLDPNLYTIQAGGFDHGQIFASPGYGTLGTTVHLDIDPDGGYKLKEGSLEYRNTSGTRTSIDSGTGLFILPADHVKIYAEFESLPVGSYTVKVERAAHGYITARPSYGPKNTKVFLWVTPDPGYRLQADSLQYKVDSGVTKITGKDRTFSLPNDHVLVRGIFEKVSGNDYTVRIEPLIYGRILADPEFGPPGTVISLDIDPAFPLKPGSLKYKGVNGKEGNIDETTNRFSLPDDHVTIYAEFGPMHHPITIANTPHGRITTNISHGGAGDQVILKVEPDNGYRYKANSLHYLDSTGTKHPIEKTLQFTMPADQVTVGAEFIPFSAMKDLKINNRSPISLVDGKTDYTAWIPAQDRTATITFTTVEGAKAKPKSNTSHTLTLFENKPVQYLIEDPDGITKTTYTFTMIRELVPTGEVPAGKLNLEEIKNTEITKPFRIGTYELTEAEWSRVMGYDLVGSRDDYPVRGMTWYEAVMFCNKLSMLEKKTPAYSLNNQTDPDSWGKAPSGDSVPPWNIIVDWNANGYRLPTEMEWLWAAIGAASGIKELCYAGSASGMSLDDVAWYFRTARGNYHLKGTKKPNELGLYDMSGNVAEWCWDWYDGETDFRDIPDGGRDYTGPGNGSLRVVRGGNVNNEVRAVSLSFRGDKPGDPNTAPYEAAKGGGMRIFCRD